MTPTSPSLRRLAVYLHLQDLVAGRDVVELVRTPDPAASKLLTQKGARRVSAAVPNGTAIGLPDGSADVLFALDLQPEGLAGLVREARRVLRPEGLLVIGVPSRDRPGASDGASYYDVVDACGAFGRTQMIGLAPFSGTTLVEYGVADPEPILDGTLVERGERVDYYVAVAGPERRGDFGYGVVQLPMGAAVPASAGDDASALRHRITRLESELAEARRAPAAAAAPAPSRTEPSQDRVVAELRQAIERHAGEMKAKLSELAERDAYIAELEGDARRVDELEGRLARAEKGRAEAEHKERDARRRIAELEGQLRAGGGGNGGHGGPGGTNGGGNDDVAALRKKLAEAEAETWKQMKARSEVEAAAAELREDTVRKLKDARKLASVELMRAMEEATKKAVTLRDDLARSENERKAAIAELKALRDQGPTMGVVQEDGHHRRDLARAREEGEAAALAARALAARERTEVDAARVAAEAAAREAEERAAQLRIKLQSTERALAAAERERDEARATMAAERARADLLASRGGAEAVGEAQSVAAVAREREELSHQLERLRAELADRERRAVLLEQERPPRAEVDRARGELEAARTRVSELQLELQRREAAVERASSVAAHERARSERLVAGERQALAERNDARARAAEAQARVAGLESDRERAQSGLEVAEARAHKAENEIKEKRERIRQLKRELEDAERRAQVSASRGRALEVVRARAQALEAAVAGEATRLAGIEATLRQL